MKRYDYQDVLIVMQHVAHNVTGIDMLNSLLSSCDYYTVLNLNEQGKHLESCP